MDTHTMKKIRITKKNSPYMLWIGKALALVLVLGVLAAAGSCTDKKEDKSKPCPCEKQNDGEDG